MRRSFWVEEVGQASEWNSLYMIIVFAIAALLLISLIKPTFRQTQTIVQPITNSVGASK